ncbi:hypothetical protein Bca4012_066229 [Brassica carinata]|uniref:GRF-type domain-containing protein n=1 Tax=Brassica carinata TaxID=52824 RepID=A0A8X8AYM7_BRACI|nr:hypothetical protein Bca52824_018534 [Brassica carinata]
MEEANSGRAAKIDNGGSCSRRNRASFEGVPTHCWCGNRVSSFVSKTKKNPFRRFYRCVVARQREGESHLFKWVEDALVEEIYLVEARQTTVEEDIEALATTRENEDVHRENTGCVGAFTWFCSKFR